MKEIYEDLSKKLTLKEKLLLLAIIRKGKR